MRKKNPFITVFTPNYNGSKYISETIESVIKQSYTNFEYIIIDDHSTDNSWQIIQKYAKKDQRIKTFRNTRNLQIVKNRNCGFQHSSPEAKYFAIIDSDDVALPDKLKIQVNFLQNNPDYGLVGSNIIIINKNSQVIGFRKYPSTDNDIRKSILRFNPIAQSSVILRKDVIDEIGMYDETWRVCQDYDYWLRVGISWKFANINKPLIKYRLSSTQVKSTNLKETLQNTYKIQKKAIEKYGYKDTLLNKFFRIILKYSTIYSKIAYYVYKFRIIKSKI